jgi:hypothetical protein
MKRAAALLIQFAIVALPLGICALTQAQTEQPGPLFPAEQGGKWGYIDKTGKYIWQPQE